MSAENSDLEVEYPSGPDTSTSSSSSISPYAAWVQHVVSRRFQKYDERNATPMVDDDALDESFIMAGFDGIAQSTLLDLSGVEELSNVSINERRISIVDPNLSQLCDDEDEEEEKTPVPNSKTRPKATDAAEGESSFKVVQPSKIDHVPNTNMEIYFDDFEEYRAGEMNLGTGTEHWNATYTMSEPAKLLFDENQNNVQSLIPRTPKLGAMRHFYWSMSEEQVIQPVEKVSLSTSMSDWDNYEKGLGHCASEMVSEIEPLSDGVSQTNLFGLSLSERPELLKPLATSSASASPKPKKRKTSRFMSGLDTASVIEKDETQQDRFNGDMVLRPKASLIKTKKVVE